MVHKQRTLTNDPQADERYHHGNQDAEEPERIVDKQLSDPGAELAAEVFDLAAEQFALFGGLLKNALIDIPAHKREKHRGNGKEAAEKQHQSADPAETVAVGSLDALTSVRRGGAVLECHR